MKTLLFLLLLTTAVPVSAQDCYFCPPNQPWWLNIFNWDSLPQVPQEPPLVTIETPTLTRDAGASYCRRNEDVVDTIVFHHSETPSTSTVQQINQMHLNRGTAADPWLMIAYHYVINSPYNGNPNPKPKISQGRPFNISGSHAGTGVFKPANEETRRLMRLEGAMRCGLKDGPLKEADDKFNAAGEVKANYNTVAILIVGNYAKKSSSNPGGANPARVPTAATVELAAKLACQIQREHPRIKDIKWHNYYKPTSCPGTIENKIAQIKAAAARYGCTFN